jgi:hypothetical protein
MKYPGQELLELLNDIRLNIKENESIPILALKYRLENSGVERTLGLLNKLGDDCSYYRKSLDIFLRRDYNDIYKIVFNIKEVPEYLVVSFSRAREIMEMLGVEG